MIWLNQWYDRQKEPWRFVIAVLILLPAILASTLGGNAGAVGAYYWIGIWVAIRAPYALREGPKHYSLFVVCSVLFAVCGVYSLWRLFQPSGE